MLQGSLLEQSKILKLVHSLLGQSVFILGPKTWQRLWKTYSERPDSCGPPEHLGIHRAQLETPYLVPPLCSTDLSNLPQTHIIIFLLLWSSKDSSQLQLKMEMVCSFIQFWFFFFFLIFSTNFIAARLRKSGSAAAPPGGSLFSFLKSVKQQD